MRTIALISSFLLAALPALAQEGLDRSVEVTKAYTPTGQTVQKIAFEPQMEDSVPLQPDGHYRILPIAWQSDFHVAPIIAAGVDARLVEREPLLYLQAGAGGPLRSQLEAHLHYLFFDSYAGAWLRHRGQYDDLSDDLGQKTHARSTANALGGYFHTDLAGDDLGVLLEAHGAWDYFTRYGRALPIGTPLPAPALADPSIQSYGLGGAKLSLGNDFDSLGRFTWRVAVGANTLKDRIENGQEEFHSSLDMGYRIGASRIALKGWWDVYRGTGDNLKYYKNTMLGIQPTYEFTRGEFDLLVGLGMVFDNIRASQIDDTYLFPRLRIEWNPASGTLLPFLDVSGSVHENGVGSLIARNPYARTDYLPGHNTALYQAQLGVTGSIAGAFAYKLFVSERYYNNRIFFEYDYNAPGSFQAERQDVSQFSIGTQLSARIAGNLDLLAEGSLNFLDKTGNAWMGMDSKDERVAELPEFEAGFEARYNYRNRFSTSAGIDAIGPRYFCVGSSRADQKIDTQLDLHLRVDVPITSQIGLWAEGQNLLGKELYPYQHYRMPRAILGGVSLKFQ